MWTREQIKSRAKDVLKYSYWPAFLVTIVMGITSGNSGGSSGNYTKIMNSGGQLFGESTTEIMLVLLAFAGVAVGILLFIKIFLGYALEVGGMKFFIEASESNVSLSNLGYCFKEGRFFKVLLTMLLKDIYIFLWTLLLIIPGIIKGYSYGMVPFILADNPKIGYNRAIELSKNMTDGEKMDIFILDLSFIGWYLLGTLACCIGVLFVQPYYYATRTELYFELREQALQNGLTSLDELNLEYPTDENEKPPSRIDFTKSEKDEI